MTDKIILNNISTFQNDATGTSTINNNNAVIVQAIDNTLSRDGTSPNQMLSDFDMNSHRIINLPAPASSQEPLRLQDAATLNGGGTISSLPVGGTTGQNLVKNSNTNFDAGWASPLSAPVAGTNIVVTGTNPVTVATSLTPTFTTVNKVAFTAPATGSTLTIADGKTLTVNNSLILTGTDGTSFAHPSTSDTLTGLAATQTLTNKVINGANNTLTVRLANDVTGNLPVTNMNSGSSASSSTFWRGDGTWASVAVGTVGITIEPQGRLTLTSVTPILTSTVSGATSMIYTPYKGNIIPLYNGSTWTATQFAEISTLLTDTTKNPAAIGASKVNDWFIWNDSGTIRICHGPDWTNDTTRSAGTALLRINGVLTNNVAITNGPVINQGTYVGTSRSNGSSTIDFTYAAAASGGTAAFFGLWNYWNRVAIPTTVTDSGATYAYTTGTIRQCRASAGNQISFVVGVQEEAANINMSCEGNPLGVLNAACSYGIGLDSTSAFSFGRAIILTPSTNATVGTINQHAPWLTPIGLHFISMNEKGDGSNANIFDSNATNYLSATIRL